MLDVASWHLWHGDLHRSPQHSSVPPQGAPHLTFATFVLQASVGECSHRGNVLTTGTLHSTSPNLSSR